MEQLSLEQRFSIHSFAQKIKDTNEETAKELLVKLYVELIIKDNYYKKIIKERWGVEADCTISVETENANSTD